MPKYVYFNGQTFSSVLNSFLLLQSFWVKNAKIVFFRKKMVSRVFFIKLTFRWLQTGLSDLYHLQTNKTVNLCYGLYSRKRYYASPGYLQVLKRSE